MTAPRYTRVPGAAPRPEERPRRRPELRLVEEDGAGRHRRTRVLTVFAVVAVVAGLFAIVFLHVVLSQEQVTLDRLDAQAEALEAENQRLRVEVAELESPNRIVPEARQRLGLTTPTSVVSLGGAPDPGRTGNP